jgi:hypothetical protein
MAKGSVFTASFATSFTTGFVVAGACANAEEQKLPPSKPNIEAAAKANGAILFLTVDSPEHTHEDLGLSDWG